MRDENNGNGRDTGNVLTLPIKSAPALDPKPQYDCAKCPGYCCSYKRIGISERDINRLARHFDIDPATALRRFTKLVEGDQVLRHQKDPVYGTICMFFDIVERRCTVYHARPGVCREYPERPRCGYYEFLRWERRHQGDPDFIPLT